MKMAVIALALPVMLALCGSGVAATASLAQGSAQAAENELVLDGVIIADNPADSIALIRRTDAKRARPMRLGNDHAGYVLVEVTRSGVVLEGPGGLFRLALGGGAKRSTASENESDVQTPAGADWVRRSFSRTETSAVLEKEIPVILSDTELTPRVVEGEVRGLELLRLPDGTVLSRTGLMPGDVLQSLNEQPLRGLDSLLNILASFENVNELRLVVERRGEVVRFAYDLTN